MTRVKICGITRVETLELLARSRADYVGFVFAKSRRQVTAEAAGEMLRQVPEHPAAVGVFVNPTLTELERVLSVAPLQVIQLHGQESPDFCANVRKRFSLQVWKAISIGEGKELSDELESYRPQVDAFLFDTHDQKLAGGTGKRFAWTEIPRLRKLAGDTPFFVAGGIHLDNLGELLEGYRPEAIDISSGVETDGQKDHGKITQLLERVREYDRQSRN
ncbi:phosphoribosylanthranilate isomerase [Brevibacillus massiliensis]|jgi:phosphoribosylanthranilate isomerase|uniref:phosphoribosylanthranilate isomerase n=1 Tax=Brevibacillus massiliensis TaxID=1118054 RepID=UPI00030B1B36|nr:phosphoribosylanthranilate isomerase [Brevibacillus massiliensis]